MKYVYMAILSVMLAGQAWCSSPLGDDGKGAYARVGINTADDVRVDVSSKATTPSAVDFSDRDTRSFCSRYKYWILSFTGALAVTGGFLVLTIFACQEDSNHNMPAQCNSTWPWGGIP